MKSVIIKTGQRIKNWFRKRKW